MTLVVPYELKLHDLVCLDQNESSGDEPLLNVTRYLSQPYSVDLGNGLEESSYRTVPDTLTAYRGSTNEVETGDAISLETTIPFYGRADIALSERDRFGFFSFNQPLGRVSIQGSDYMNQGVQTLDFVAWGAHYQLTFEVQSRFSGRA